VRKTAVDLGSEGGILLEDVGLHDGKGLKGLLYSGV
jgi:hypothetical protein